MILSFSSTSRISSSLSSSPHFITITHFIFAIIIILSFHQHHHLMIFINFINIAYFISAIIISSSSCILSSLYHIWSFSSIISVAYDSTPPPVSNPCRYDYLLADEIISFWPSHHFFTTSTPVTLIFCVCRDLWPSLPFVTDGITVELISQSSRPQFIAAIVIAVSCHCTCRGDFTSCPSSRPQFIAAIVVTASCHLNHCVLISLLQSSSQYHVISLVVATSHPVHHHVLSSLLSPS